MLRVHERGRAVALNGVRDFFGRLLQRPDALMLELGAGGELLVAQLRATLSLVLLVLPLVNIITGEYRSSEALAGMLGAITAVVASQAWLALARHPGRYRWLPWATASYDVTLTTLVLALLSLGTPAAGLNSMVVWVFYLVSVCMTALRNDGRLTLYTGILATLQYALLAQAVFTLAPAPEQLMSVDYGTATTANVVQRLVLIGMVTAITATVVYRMQRLVDMSGTDGLTGLPNRTWLVHRFPAVLESTRHAGGSLSVCLIDLDYFKRINDEIGHLAGDRALRHVVGVLDEQLEETDWLSRLGGEEFALLMALPTGRAWERLEIMRRAVASRPFVPEPGADPMRLTFSAGIASWPQDGSDLSQLLRRADVRLRQAKLEGRNRILARDP
ncbi:MAG: GGDEF domain-containing protein [Lysobacteraceae bacterium]|nr:MAG: GGDEF domain-containing protein [Xanthomonadaceae bacterium]